MEGQHRRRAGGTWTAIGWIALSELVFLVISAVAVTASFALSDRTVSVIQSIDTSPLQELDTAPPPGAQAIPEPAAGGARGTVDARAAAARVGPATVSISADSRYQLTGGGSGAAMVLTSSGLVLTDEHVITGADGITAQIGGSGRTYQAALIGVDLADDVALLQLEHASGLRTVTLGRSAHAAVGDPVVVLGYPDEGGPSTAVGRLIGLNEVVDLALPPDERGSSSEPKSSHYGMLRNDAHTRPGYSGGPVIDSAGLVIGMAQVGGEEDYDIPIDRALTVAREIASGHAGSHVLIGAPGELGVVARTSSPSAGRPVGARVVTVHAGTPARVLGIEAGDVITAVDGSDIVSAAELRQMLARHGPGDRTSVTWTDSRGHRHTVVAQLSAGPAP